MPYLLNCSFKFVPLFYVNVTSIKLFKKKLECEVNFQGGAKRLYLQKRADFLSKKKISELTLKYCTNFAISMSVWHWWMGSPNAYEGIGFRLSQEMIILGNANTKTHNTMFYKHFLCKVNDLYRKKFCIEIAIVMDPTQRIEIPSVEHIILFIYLKMERGFSLIPHIYRHYLFWPQLSYCVSLD